MLAILGALLGAALGGWIASRAGWSTMRALCLACVLLVVGAAIGRAISPRMLIEAWPAQPTATAIDYGQIWLMTAFIRSFSVMPHADVLLGFVLVGAVIRRVRYAILLSALWAVAITEIDLYPPPAWFTWDEHAWEILSRVPGMAVTALIWWMVEWRRSARPRPAS